MQYPEEKLLPLFYKFIYKYEKLEVKKLSDKKIKGFISASAQKDYDDVILELKNYCYQSPYKDNSMILQHKKSQQGQLPSAYEFYFDKRTMKSSYVNDLLRHIRNVLTHVCYNMSGNYYELIEKSNNYLSAYGHIKEADMLKLINSFVAQ